MAKKSKNEKEAAKHGKKSVSKHAEKAGKLKKGDAGTSKKASNKKKLGRSKEKTKAKAGANPGLKSNKTAVRIAPKVDLSVLKCPCCGKHCPLSKPKCGKGRAVAKKTVEKATKSSSSSKASRAA